MSVVAVVEHLTGQMTKHPQQLPYCVVIPPAHCLLSDDEVGTGCPESATVVTVRLHGGRVEVSGAQCLDEVVHAVRAWLQNTWPHLEWQRRYEVATRIGTRWFNCGFSVRYDPLRIDHNHRRTYDDRFVLVMEGAP